MVSDIGPPDARIMFIGESPGAMEERTGAVFAGQGGKLLQQMCRHVGIIWKECYATNIVDRRPRRADFGIYYEDKGRRTPTPELQERWALAQHKIRTIKPSVIVTLGAEALRAVTGKRGVDSWRGCPTEYEGIPVIPTYKPGAIIKQYGLHPVAELDISKAGRYANGRPEIKKWDITLAPTFHQVKRWLKGCRGKTVSFDLESIGQTVRCLGMARDDKSICIPFLQFEGYQPARQESNKIIFVGERQAKDGSSYWNARDELKIIQLLDEFFSDETITKVGQNSLGFDQPFLEKEFGWTFKNHSFDCMHGFHLLYPELPKSLSFLCSILTDYKNYWTGKNTQDDVEEWTYNCWDTIITLDAYEIIQKDLKSSGLFKFYDTHLHKLAQALARAQERGVLIDTDRRDELIGRYEAQRVECQAEVRVMSERPELNINSHPQLKKLIYEDMKFKPVTNRTGNVSTDEECLKKLMKEYPKEPLFQGIIDFRKAGKMIDFLRSKIGEDGRMRTSFNASGTKTGRISSSQTIWGTGMNLMNVPKYLRDIFVAPEGRSFIKEDLAQAETMVVAEILKRHGDTTLWDRYQDPEFDIHTWMAACIYKKPEKKITKFERNVGKIANHSGNYRAGPQVLVTTAIKRGIPGITYQVAREVLQERSRALPGLEKWWQWVEDELRQKRILTTCLGRRRIFFGRLDHATFRDATSFEPQSTVGDATNIIFAGLDRELDSDCYPVLQVHDEVVIECPDKKIGKVLDTLHEVGQVELWVNEDKPLIIPMDIGIGKNWKNCKDI